MKRLSPKPVHQRTGRIIHNKISLISYSEHAKELKEAINPRYFGEFKHCPAVTGIENETLMHENAVSRALSKMQVASEFSEEIARGLDYRDRLEIGERISVSTLENLDIPCAHPKRESALRTYGMHITADPGFSYSKDADA